MALEVNIIDTAELYGPKMAIAESIGALAKQKDEGQIRPSWLIPATTSLAEIRRFILKRYQHGQREQKIASVLKKDPIGGPGALGLQRGPDTCTLED